LNIHDAYFRRYATNDLSIPTNFESLFPTLPYNIQRAYNILNEIKSFEDIERVFLKGAGLSVNTYKTYLDSVKQFYRFTNHKLPTQCTPADVEAFYDELCKHVDRNTAYLRIKGLKKYFEGVKRVIPFYESPFDIMGENLNRKMGRPKRGTRTKKTLTPAEVKRLLSWLSKDTSEYGLGNYAIVFMLVTSGLRAEELMQLTWKNIEFFEGRWMAYFTDKGGGREAEQELYTPAVKTCRRYFEKVFNRRPEPEDCLFWTVPRFSWR